MIFTHLCFQVNEIQFSRTGHFYVAAGHPTGHGMFEIMRVSCDGKGKPFLENLHKVMPHTQTCYPHNDLTCWLL